MLIDMNSKSTDLYSVGDCELWYASAQDGSWSFPLYVQWCSDKSKTEHFGLVMPAVYMYYAHGLALAALLGAHNEHDRRDCWLIKKHMVEGLLHKAPGVTPLAYYKWPGDGSVPPAIPKVLKINRTAGIATTVPVTHNKDGFVKLIASKTGLQPGIVGLVVKTIGEEAATWMIENRSVIDLGFCKLFAAPFRANWKQIMAFKFKKWSLLGMLKKPKDEMMDSLEDGGVIASLCSLHNIAIKKNGHRYRIDYTIEAIPSKSFGKEVDAIESKRIALGGTSYVASFEKSVMALCSPLIESLEAYLHKTGLPFARIWESSSPGKLRLLPTSSQSVKVRGVPVRAIPEHIVTPDNPFSINAEQSDEILVRAKAPQVQKMPAVLQIENDVRGCEKQPDLVEQEHAGTNGLSMQHVDQGEVQRKPMFPGVAIGTGDSSGMDK